MTPSSVPKDVVHYVVWSRRPFTHADTVAPPIVARVTQDGLWGFTGGPERPVKLDDPHSELLKLASGEIHTFVSKLWDTKDWETAWFLNPPVSFGIWQSRDTP